MIPTLPLLAATWAPGKACFSLPECPLLLSPQEEETTPDHTCAHLSSRTFLLSLKSLPLECISPPA